MTQRKVLVIDAGHQAFDELDATDLTSGGAAPYTVGGTDVPITDGGTGASTASGARTNLGLGTAAVAATGDFDAAGAAAAAQAASQPVDATLTALAGLATGANKLPYSTGTDAFSQADLTAAGRALIDDADASAQRTTLGLGTLATQSGTFSGTSSGTNTGDQTVPAFATPAIVLGTAAAAGAASTVIRSDGTIAAFDATVPTTQAFSDAAATGSAAVAARRDHLHGIMALPAIDATGAATDITTRNVSTSAHGLTPKLPNDATKYLDGTGAYTVPVGSGSTPSWISTHKWGL